MPLSYYILYDGAVIRIFFLLLIREAVISTFKLILASSSPYRKLLLQRLDRDFSCVSPNIDETPMPDESTSALVERLATQKAQKVAETHESAWIIGSDQVAVVDGQILGKSGSLERARRQLAKVSGRAVEFTTGLALLDSSTGAVEVCHEIVTVYFRVLSDAEIERYLEIEKPFNCACSFQSEGMGISLTEKIISQDPTTLIGLPLIKLTIMLRNRGVAIP